MILLLLFCFSQVTVRASTVTRSSYGVKVKWPYSSISLSVDPTGFNAMSLSESTVMSAVNNSVNSWTAYGAPSTNISLTYSGNQSASNVIYLDSAAYLGSGVVGLTTLSYDPITGDILEADIALNDSFSFTTNSNDTSATAGKIYLNDVLTHELGHLYGIGHSEVINSTMLYTAFSGQSSLSKDDQNVTTTQYSSNSGGTISGKVVGGAELVPIFGVHVQAISALTGQVAGAVMSDDTGHFAINALDTSDSYYILMSPIKKVSALSNYYSTVRSDFCGGESFQTSFFHRCGDDYKSRPQAISFISSTSIDIGHATIKCGNSVSADYLATKFESPRTDFDPLINANNLHVAHTGMFMASEITSADVDTLSLDLSAYDTSSGSYHLNISLLTHLLYSPLHFTIKVKDNSNAIVATSSNYSSSSVDVDRHIVNFKVPLSTTAASNTFKIEITPNNLSSSSTTHILGQFYDSHVNFVSEATNYFLMANIVKYNGASYNFDSPINDMPYEDNYYCPESMSAYNLSAYKTSQDAVTSSSSPSQKKQNSSEFLSCGTVDIDPGNGPGSGPFSMALSLLLPMLMISFSAKRQKIL